MEGGRTRRRLGGFSQRLRAQREKSETEAFAKSVVNSIIDAAVPEVINIDDPDEDEIWILKQYLT